MSTVVELPSEALAPVADVEQDHVVCCEWTDESPERAIAFCGIDATDIPWDEVHEDRACRVCWERSEMPCDVACPELLFGKLPR